MPRDKNGEVRRLAKWEEVRDGVIGTWACVSCGALLTKPHKGSCIYADLKNRGPNAVAAEVKDYHAKWFAEVQPRVERIS